MMRRTGTKAIRRGFVAAGAVTLSLAAACSDGGGTSPDVSTVSSLVRFDTCDELSAWVAEEMVPHVGPYGLQEEWLTPVDTPAGDVLDGAPDPGSAREDGAAPAPDMEVDSNVGAADAPMDGPSEAPVDAPGGGSADAPATPGSDQTTYSETNVQVEGVDEPDILKTDGERIVAVADDTVHLASAETSRLLDSAELPDGMSDPEMMLYGDRIVLFGSLRHQPGETAVAELNIRGGMLSSGDTYVIEGDYVSARMLGSVVRLVTQSTPHDQFPFVSPASDTEEAREHAASVNRDLLADADSRDLLPGWRQVDEDGDALDEGELFSCDQVHGPDQFAGFGTTSVVTFDVTGGVGDGIASSGGAGVLAEAETVYSSHEHLYVASHQFGEAGSTDDDGDGVDGVDIGGPGDIAPDTAPDEVSTAIHRFDISDPSEASYDVSGRVDGVLLNQFALDEHDGNLRVATTTGSPFGTGDNQSESHVTVLEPTSDALVEVGSVSGLGEGETIHAVRFMGETGYVVTFQQVDPLYVIDLSDPSRPAETGELKILGYSAYLHPVGDGLLLGVGQDADETGRLEGTQVSLFDVSDPTDPERVAQHTLDDATSAAEGDHRAFLWWQDTELAAIPASTWGSGGSGFEGLIGFTIDREGQQIEELGRVEHSDDATSGRRHDDVEDLSLEVDGDGDGDELSWDTPDPARDDIAEPITPAPEPSGSPIMRSLVIGDALWTLSHDGLGHSDLETLDDTEVIQF